MPRAAAVILELDAAALDRHPRRDRLSRSTKLRAPWVEQRAEIDRQCPRWRASARRCCWRSGSARTGPIAACARRGSRSLRGRRVAAVGLRLRGGDQRHHLRSRAARCSERSDSARKPVSSTSIMTPKNSASGSGDRDQQPPAERMHGARRLSAAQAAPGRARARSGSRGRAASRSGCS